MSVIGIDLGGTKISGAVFDKSGNLLYETKCLLNGATGKFVGKLITQTIEKLTHLANNNNDSIEAIGICVPGIADSKTGLIWAPNIDGWQNYPLQNEIEDFLRNSSIKVKIDSDRTCYILGETWKGAAYGSQNAVFVAVGTGIGMGILIDGHILHGNADITGAAGWLALDIKYNEIDYPLFGCFESNASGNGIARCAQHLLHNKKFPNSILYKYDLKDITAREVFATYEDNDPLAYEVVEKAIKLWGMAAANIVSLLNPEKIVWGGGIFGPAIKFLPRIYAEACRWAQPISIKQVRFVPSELSGDAGLYGAGRLATY
ncbi:MAG: ROK family protein [Paludibacteraceae bacterium]